MNSFKKKKFLLLFETLEQKLNKQLLTKKGYLVVEELYLINRSKGFVNKKFCQKAMIDSQE